MPVERPPQAVIVVNQDDEHLTLLAVFHYLVGGLAALVALFPLLHLVLGLFMIIVPHLVDCEGDAVSTIAGWVFVIAAGSFKAAIKALDAAIMESIQKATQDMK